MTEGLLKTCFFIACIIFVLGILFVVFYPLYFSIRYAEKRKKLSGLKYVFINIGVFLICGIIGKPVELIFKIIGSHFQGEAQSNIAAIGPILLIIVLIFVMLRFVNPRIKNNLK